VNPGPWYQSLLEVYPPTMLLFVSLPYVTYWIRDINWVEEKPTRLRP
jgi:hypothetical protein